MCILLACLGSIGLLSSRLLPAFLGSHAEARRTEDFYLVLHASPKTLSRHSGPRVIIFFGAGGDRPFRFPFLSA